MKKDKNITEVVFRKFADGSILALFPYIIQDHRGSINSYMIIGQHSGADYTMSIRRTKPANEAEYKDIKKELENTGYNLKVIKKHSVDKYLTAYKNSLKF